MRMTARIRRTALLCGIFLLLLSGIGGAAEARRTESGAERPYTYNIWDESVAAPYAYLPRQVVTGISAGTTAFSSPTDVAVADDEIFLLDAGNNRIVVLNGEGSFLRELPAPADCSFADGRGISVSGDGEILIACADTERVISLNPDGTLRQVIGRPVSEIIPAEMVYKPLRAIRGTDQNIYIVAEGVYYGMVELDPAGNFLRFFGSNTVSAGIETFLSQITDLILSAAQQRKTERVLPAEYASLDMDKEGFFYTVTAKATQTSAQIKMHDPSGDNILPSGVFGDIETSVAQGRVVTSTLSDIAVQEGGFFFALDVERCKIFWYDESAQLLSVFGTKGEGEGAFSDPIAVAAMGDKCLVLDRKSGKLTIFSPSDYGADLRTAILLYNDNRYEESVELWKDLRERNNNLEIVYTGIGKAAFGTGDYTAAMNAYQKADNRTGYSQAFRAYRSELMQQWFPLIFGILAVVLVGVWIAISRKVNREKRRDDGEKIRGKITPFYVMFHPAGGYELIKTEKRGSILYATLSLAAVIFFRLVSLRYTAFLFNYGRVEDINFGFEAGQVLLVFAVWIASVWAVGSFIDGEGFFRELYITTGYALMPYAISMLIGTAVSHILSLDEGALYSGISMIGLYWSVILVFMTLMKIQRYTFKRAIVSVFLTLLIILFICFLFVLAYSLVGQFGSFLETVGRELSFRLQ
ncbi:MAG: hypothetical protein E7486_01790 [Ruminococcaceae bacterium]|nr:hypothetical protein [Oscillospiraceae bacterium]